MDARKRYRYLLIMQKRDLPREKRVQLKTLLYKALAPSFICTNFGSWIRVFEVGPECVADTKAIEASFKLFGDKHTRFIEIYNKS